MKEIKMVSDSHKSSNKCAGRDKNANTCARDQKKDAEENKSNEVHKQKDQVENAGHNNLLTKKKFQKNLSLSL